MGSRGFSIVELLVATTVLLVVTAEVFALLASAQGGFAAQTEAADVQQRLRGAANALVADITAAGSGPDGDRQAGPLVQSFAPVLPLRFGTRSDDPPGTFFADRITLLSVPQGAPHAAVAASAPAFDSDGVGVEPMAQCAPSDPLCLFAVGADVALFDGNGSVDLFSITDLTAEPSMPVLQHVGQRLAFTAYRRSDAVVAGMATVTYTYDRRTAQLVVSRGVAGIDAPIVDNVVRLSFEYLGDPLPPQIGTYGPQPPALDIANPNPAWPPGENCVFAVAGGLHVPRLPALGDGTTLTALSAAQLRDGPWCPDAWSANRWDADLLRIRTVVATVRVQAAVAALRGPAGALFTNGGTAADARRWVPDREITFRISPPNLNLGRVP